METKSIADEYIVKTEVRSSQDGGCNDKNSADTQKKKILQI